ncbi:acyl carrier protein [Pseudochrobactrum algeriensis]|uniref:Acyl carrier protein n=1 Tax=Pseudochrobactrum saccharolyticum TaxID=354352 RepID=A0A7W8EQP4_9HYPH|nr:MULTISPECIES: acyl carrier protein [Pseudochrobactrum]MBX8812766.1 acyl carrier protein [Ochrobactrum sp. MR34]KAB0537389.1 acyl carrier protein [Pseudochrobactrum saccharolyticum]MBB5092116.1 acyl carrier protein [Pseudochrobactrum saccharolyticum]QVQ36337.1 acyl carrier protein [Pseudochrobactrum algeriensis]QVQ39555.1 acyl carrier protein [Pseudochrobactrum algeriensis]
MSDTIKDRLRAFIIENFLFGDTDYALEDDASLIDNDVMDSTGVLELIAFIDEAFGIKMADADIVPANLDSLSKITAYVTARKAA